MELRYLGEAMSVVDEVLLVLEGLLKIDLNGRLVGVARWRLKTRRHSGAS